MNIFVHSVWTEFVGSSDMSKVHTDPCALFHAPGKWVGT